MSVLNIGSITQCTDNTCKEVNVNTLNRCRDTDTGDCSQTDICGISPLRCADSDKRIPIDCDNDASANPMSFQDRLEDAFTKVNGLQHEANDAMKKAVKGEIGVHEAMMQMQEASLSLKVMMTVRGKIMDGYKEIINIQA